MKIVTFQGGLGNQMFQYVFYLWLKSKHKRKIYGYYPHKGLKNHNGLEIDKVFTNIELPISNLCVVLVVYILKILRKIGLNMVSNKENIFNNDILYEDYWQDLFFYNGFEFKFDTEKFDILTQSVLSKIQLSNSVSLHVRRGDYLLNENTAIYSGVCDVEYYKNAIIHINQNVNNPFFFIFSDDMSWVRENLQIENSILVDWNVGESSSNDLFLMSQCKHNIIANSTFSWWGAFLNKFSDKIVISPQKWFANSVYSTPQIIPDEWIKI